MVQVKLIVHFCSQNGAVVVADFGLARVLADPTEKYQALHAQRSPPKQRSSHIKKKSTRKKRYTVVGNPFWMAPEMMTGKSYDEKVDCFSFGIVICEVSGEMSG